VSSSLIPGRISESISLMWHSRFWMSVFKRRADFVGAQAVLRERDFLLHAEGVRQNQSRLAQAWSGAGAMSHRYAAKRPQNPSAPSERYRTAQCRFLDCDGRCAPPLNEEARGGRYPPPRLTSENGRYQRMPLEGIGQTQAHQGHLLPVSFSLRSWSTQTYIAHLLSLK
jgi:hypothetical protein